MPAVSAQGNMNAEPCKQLTWLRHDLKPHYSEAKGTSFACQARCFILSQDSGELPAESQLTPLGRFRSGGEDRDN